LSGISALRVISRTSVMHLKGTHEPLPQIARELNVDTVLEGSVQRSGNRLRITAQLIDARQEKHLWARTYDRDLRDVLLRQGDVAAAIAKQIAANTTPAGTAKLSAVSSVDPDAYQMYLQGLYYIEKGSEDSARESRRYFQQATAKDPGYARAWVGLARVCNR